MVQCFLTFGRSHSQFLSFLPHRTEAIHLGKCGRIPDSTVESGRNFKRPRFCFQHYWLSLCHWKSHKPLQALVYYSAKQVAHSFIYLKAFVKYSLDRDTVVGSKIESQIRCFPHLQRACSQAGCDGNTIKYRRRISSHGKVVWVPEKPKRHIVCSGLEKVLDLVCLKSRF